ncbi:MAG: hypothetical protein J5935_01385 [Lachnospiraceae bacterium]|nr:hypothetical protein [Lachnospiraceae bacterium]
MSKKIVLASAILFVLLLAASGCAGTNAQQGAQQSQQQETPQAEEETPAEDPLAQFPKADMSGYAGLADYDKETVFVDMTVKDVLELMDRGETFAVLTSFPDCPWCNATIRYVNDAALEAGVKVGSLNTRKDPSWQSNLDITDYDLFAEYFGECLEYDNNGIRHLYVPHIFYIKDGEIVYDHQGALPAMGDDPHLPLTEEQKEELREIFRAGFRR